MLSLLTPLILLALHPRSLIQLTLQTLSAPTTAFTAPFSSDPSTSSPPAPGPPRGTGAGAAEKAALINAAMLALVDAAVECRGMLLAAAVAFVAGEDGEQMLLDPTPAEEDRASSTHVFAFSFGVGVGGVEGECVGVDSTGSFSPDDVRSDFISLRAGDRGADRSVSSCSTHKTSRPRRRGASWLLCGEV